MASLLNSAQILLANDPVYPPPDATRTTLTVWFPAGGPVRSPPAGAGQTTLMTAPTCLLLTSPTKCWLGPIGGDDDVACAGIAVPTAAIVASSATRRYQLTILIR